MLAFHFDCSLKESLNLDHNVVKVPYLKWNQHVICGGEKGKNIQKSGGICGVLVFCE